MSLKKKMWLGVYLAVGTVVAFINPALVIAWTGLVHVANLMSQGSVFV